MKSLLFIKNQYYNTRIPARPVNQICVRACRAYKERNGAIMKHQRIAAIFVDPSAFDGKEMTVCGWARNLRDMKNFGFIELNDGSCFKPLQVVFERATLNNYDEIARQNVGAALIVRGRRCWIVRRYSTVWRFFCSG